MSGLFATRPDSIALSTNEDYTSQRQSQNCSSVKHAMRSVWDSDAGVIKKVKSRGTFISTFNLSKFQSTESRDSCSAVNMTLTGVTRGLGYPIPAFLKPGQYSKSAKDTLADIQTIRKFDASEMTDC